MAKKENLPCQEECMTQKENLPCHCGKRTSCGPSGAVYGLGMIGAAVYFMQQATTFWTGVVGILKALVWPAFAVYEMLKFLQL